MASGAGYRLVRAFKGIRRLLMILQLEPRGQKALGVVAGLAARAFAPPRLRQLPQMGVGVAGGATLEDQTPKLRALPWKRAVAAGASNGAMKSFQRESCLVMEVRALHGSTFDSLPSGGAVTACTSAAEFSLVRIPMAVLAGLVRHLVEAHDAPRHRSRKRLRRRSFIPLRRMAARAVDLDVSTGEGKIGLAVIKSRRWLPALLAVTGFAPIAQLAAVLVEVACVATRGEPEIRLAPTLPREEVGNLFVLDQARLVTLVAIYLGMLAKERIPHFLVRKSFLGRSPLDELKLSPVVLVMTALATSVLVWNVAMKAGALRQLRLELGVTRHAFLSRNLFAAGVALGAVAQPLQAGMGFGERAG